jgi:hypothetical protein
MIDFLSTPSLGITKERTGSEMGFRAFLSTPSLGITAGIY